MPVPVSSKRPMLYAATLWLAVMGASCSGTHATGPGGGGGAADTTTGWKTLIGRSWTAGPGVFAYECTTVQAPADLYITGFRTAVTQSELRAVVTIGASAPTTGDYDCAMPSEGDMIYASGVGTDAFVFPSGVGVHIAAGQYITLNLMLVNEVDTSVTVAPQIQVKTASAANVTTDAEMFFVGTLSISIPSDGLPHTTDGNCFAVEDEQVFALWPTMNMLGRHQTVTVMNADSTHTLLDTDYDIEHQHVYPLTPAYAVHLGDYLVTTCTYVNNTGSTVNFSSSFLGEVCFTGMYRAPARGGNTIGECVLASLGDQTAPAESIAIPEEGPTASRGDRALG